MCFLLPPTGLTDYLKSVCQVQADEQNGMALGSQTYILVIVLIRIFDVLSIGLATITLSEMKMFRNDPIVLSLGIITILHFPQATQMILMFTLTFKNHCLLVSISYHTLPHTSYFMMELLVLIMFKPISCFLY